MTMKRILLAEDDPSVLKMTKRRLEHAGYEVVTATNGEEALERVRADGRVDLVLLDVKMPKLDGYQVCQRLKGNPATAEIPTIIYTASESHSEQLVDRCIELGVTDWLKKPFRSEDLLQKVRKALARDHSS